MYYWYNRQKRIKQWIADLQVAGTKEREARDWVAYLGR